MNYFFIWMKPEPYALYDDDGGRDWFFASHVMLFEERLPINFWPENPLTTSN
jgi:hypothetical protein